MFIYFKKPFINLNTILFPFSFFLNFSSLTFLIILLNIFDKPLLTTKIAIIHAITILTLRSFSGEARSIINKNNSILLIYKILTIRTCLIFPISILFYFLAFKISELNFEIVIPFFLKSVLDWIEEVYICKLEIKKNSLKIKNYIIFQICSFLTCLLVLLYSQNYFIPLLVWSLSSILIFYKFYINLFINFSKNIDFNDLKLITPHILSTIIIGMSLYIFRQVFIHLTGEEISGSFFSAFAIGGILSSFFANSLGHLSKGSFVNRYFSGFNLLLIFVLFTKVLLGLLIFALAYFEWESLKIIKNEFLFFKTLGLSMIAGCIMVLAQVKRFKILDENNKNNLLGPNLIANIITIMSVPLLFKLFGVSSLSVSFLISAIATFALYYSYERKFIFNIQNKSIVLLGLPIIICPIFFQLSGNIFLEEWGRDPSTWLNLANFNTGLKPFIYDHNNDLTKIPLPISILFCSFLIFLIGKYNDSKISLYFLCLSFILISFIILVNHNKDYKFLIQKFVNLSQFMIPYLGLIVGQMIYKQISKDQIIEKTLFLFLMFFIPFQMFSSSIQQVPALTPYVYLFSIYQHLQYVSTVFMMSFIVCFTMLWDIKYFKLFLVPLAYVMLQYSILANSLTVSILLKLGLSCFLVYKLIFYFKDKFNLLLLLTTFIVFNPEMLSLYDKNKIKNFIGNTNNYAVSEYKEKDIKPIEILDSKLNKSSENTNNNVISEYKKRDIKPIEILDNKLNKSSENTNISFLPVNAKIRMIYWEYYLKEIFNDKRILFLGSYKDNNTQYGPHNYYLELIYSYGVFSLLPILILILYSIYLFKLLLYQFKKINSRDRLFCLTLFFCLFFYLFIDNNFKVSLKQPYSGIFIFFLWGVFISKINFINKRISVNNYSS